MTKTKNSWQAKSLSVTLSVGFLIIINAIISPNFLVYAESGPSTKTIETTKTEGIDVLLVMVNLARIRTQIMLTEKSLAEGDNYMAFAHAYIPHSVIFPSIKDILEKVVNNSNSINRLESGLADMAFMIKSEVSIDKLKQKTKEFNTILDDFEIQAINPVSQTNKSLIAQTTILLLKDADKSYQLANAATLNDSAGQKIGNVQEFSKVDYQNALGLVNMSKSNYDKIASSVSKNRNSEINLSFAQLQDYMTKKLDKVEISRLISSIEKTVEDSVSSLPSHTSKTEKQDNAEIHSFQSSTGSQKGTNAVATSDISNQTAKTNESKGKTFADIQQLSRGFGIYTGERKKMGQTDESSKGVVRDNIDQIRLKLENVLQEYKEKKYDESLSDFAFYLSRQLREY